MKRVLALVFVIAVFYSCSGTFISTIVAPGHTVNIGPNIYNSRGVVIRNKSNNPVIVKTYNTNQPSSHMILKPKKRRKLYLEHNSRIEVMNLQNKPAQVRVTVPGEKAISINTFKR